MSGTIDAIPTSFSAFPCAQIAYGKGAQFIDRQATRGNSISISLYRLIIIGVAIARVKRL